MCASLVACVYVVDLHTEGNYYHIRQVTVSDSGVYECFVDNGVKPTTLAKMRVDVTCKFMIFITACLFSFHLSSKMYFLLRGLVKCTGPKHHDSAVDWTEFKSGLCSHFAGVTM